MSSRFLGRLRSIRPGAGPAFGRASGCGEALRFRGSVLIEFLLIFPVMMAILIFSVNAALAVYAKSALGAAAAEAARVGALTGSVSQMEDAARRRMELAHVPMYRPEDLRVSCTVSGDEARAELRYTYRSMLPGFDRWLGGSWRGGVEMPATRVALREKS